GNTFTYSWALISKPPTSQATLGATTLQSSAFTPDKVGLYRLALTLTDNLGFTSTTTVEFTTVTCGSRPPAALSGITSRQTLADGSTNITAAPWAVGVPLVINTGPATPSGPGSASCPANITTG